MKGFLLVLLFAIYYSAKAQNLISNSSFEEYTQCPDGENEVPFATGWENWCATPDYFNACSSNTFATVPYSLGNGIQYAHTGNAYTGFFNYWTHAWLNGYPWIRDFIGTHLDYPTQVGVKYYLTMYVSLASWLPSPCASSHIGIKLTTQSFNSYGNSFSSPLVNNSATINVDSLITDTMNWVEFSGSFIADSAYQYLVIGNFFDDEHTDTLIDGTAPYCYSYYFIDDVSLTTDSIATVVNDLPSLKVIVYPNPFRDETNIQITNCSDDQFRLELIDQLGNIYQVRYNSILLRNGVRIDLERGKLGSGIYFLFVIGEQRRAVVPLIIQ